MACTYILYDKVTKVARRLTYEELIQEFKDSKRTFKDMLYSRETTRQDIAFKKIIELKKDYYTKVSNTRSSGEPDYDTGQAYTTQRLIDSGYFKYNNTVPLVRELDTNEFIKAMKDAYQADGLSPEEAEALALKHTEKWDIINEDAREIHKLLNTFDFRPSAGKEEYDFRKHLEGTKFENIASSLWQELTKVDSNNGQYGVYPTIRSNHKFSKVSESVIQSVNLLAKLNHIGKDIVGHIDNLVIDEDGTLHIYNYKYTTTSSKNWDPEKKKKYKYQMALLKQILAYHGFNVKKTQLHIIPIRVSYSEDLNKITSVSIERPWRMPAGKQFEEYNAMAKYFISSNIEIEPIKSQVVDKINSNLNFFFPDRKVTIEGIQKTTEEWIRQNYSARVESRIKKVDKDTHTYELYINEDFSNPIKIKSSEEPLKNDELKAEVTKYIRKINTNNNEFLSNLINDIRVSKRIGHSVLGKGSNQNRDLLLAQQFIGSSLQKYFQYTIREGVKQFEWDLISNDTLLDANILVFKNKADQIDVVCLSNFDISTSTKFKGRKNIMGSYVPDSKAFGLINFKATYGNIEAVRAMTILNEVLPEITEQDFVLGELSVISSHHRGNMLTYSMETLNRDLFQEAVKVVKNNTTEFNFKNNFTTAKYVDPLKLLLYDYRKFISDKSLSSSEAQELADLDFGLFESATTREAKKVQLRALIERILRQDKTISVLTTQEIRELMKTEPDKKKRILLNLYKEAQDAYLYYSGIQVRAEEKISKMQEWVMTQNRVPNRTYQGVVNLFIKSIDDIASEVKSEYNSIYNFTTKFYDSTGFSSIRNSSIGDQAKAFSNLYRIGNDGKMLMEFRNPYENDSQTPLNAAEKTYLKRVLYEFAKIRSQMYGFDFDFKLNEIESQRYKDFIAKNRSWYFNPPLEKASIATVRSKGMGKVMEEWSDKVKRIFHDPEGYINLAIQKVGSLEEVKQMEEDFDSLTLVNPYMVGDGITGREGEDTRAEMLNKYPESFWETNVENLLAHYLEKHIQTREFNRALISIKGILLQLEFIGHLVGKESVAGVQQTMKLIQDFAKQNLFNISIMSPEEQKAMAWIHPFRQLVSKAYIAGNIVSAFRDTFEGMWQNTARMLTKYQTDIDAKSLMKAYKEVTKASFTSIRNITIIDELCKTYRLSNLDVARISEGLTTSRGGILNIENWMYSTLRTPDFLNRMVLFVAKCMHDGSWEAFDLEDNKLKYDWRKDKRYSVFSGVDQGTKEEYEEQKVAYYNAIRQYNLENPDKVISFQDEDGLPVAYSNAEIQEMRQLSNSIYGAYDKSMRAKYESTSLGLTFAMFGTWMNGMVSNYMTKPGQYSGGMAENVQETDGSGNKIFLDKDLRSVVEIEEEDSKRYIYEDTGEECTDTRGLVPAIKHMPRVIQGIWYTLKDSFFALKYADEDGNWKGREKFMEDIWSDPMQRANLRKLLSDLLGFALFTALFKLAIGPMYSNYKKEMKDHTVAENAIAEILYKSTSRSYDGFAGPIAMIQFLGENTNPPPYSLSTKLVTDISKVAFGDLTIGGLLTGNIALFRSFRDTYKAEVKKNQ